MRIPLWPQISNTLWTDADPIVRSRLMDALHVLVLFNFAVAQPIYDRLSERGALFVDQHIGMPVAYLLVGLLSAGIPGAIVLVEWLVSLCGRRYYETLHCLVLSVLLFLLALPVCKRVDFLFGPGMIICSTLGAALGTSLYLKYRPLRAVLSVASLGVVIFPVLFLIQFSANFGKSDPTAQRLDRYQPVPVVVLVFDEFCGASLMTPERKIDAQRFPNFAALARDTTWFRNATSVNPMTVQALPAILSGRYATSNYPPIPANLPQNLFSVLGASGYDRAIFEPVSSLASPGLGTTRNAPQGLWSQTTFVGNFLWRVYLFHVTPFQYQGHLPEIPRLWFGLHSSRDVHPEVTRGVFRYGWSDTREVQFQHFLKCLDASEKPTLYFMHLLLPHLPWCYLPSGSRYAEDGEDWQLLSVKTQTGLPGNWGPDELELVNNQQRYLLQLIYLDQLLGKFIARLKETGLYDKCLLVVTADHGISFRARQSRRSIGKENLDEILSIPLFVKRPGQQVGGGNDQDVESVDILPTIADVLGLNLGRATDGWSMFDAAHPPRTLKQFGEVSELQTVDPAIIHNSNVPLTIRERFGDSSDPASLYQTSHIPELIGRRVDSLKLTTTAQVEMEFLRYSDEVITGKTKTVPCFFEGRMATKRTADAPTVIAVAINGVIQGVTRTYRQPGLPSRQWTAMIPETAFHAGRNDVHFYKVTGAQPDWMLTPCVSVPVSQDP